MDSSPKSKPSPGHGPGDSGRLGRIVVMNAVERGFPDTITTVDHQSRDPNPTIIVGESSENAVAFSDASTARDESQNNPTERVYPPTGPDSPGYLRMEVVASNIRLSEKIVIFALIMLLATAHSLDNFLRILYQFDVGMDLSFTGKLAAVNAMATLSTATLTPMISKSADLWGRTETLLISVICYVSGTVLQSRAHATIMFSAGGILWTIGLHGVVSMLEIIIADFTTLELRVIMIYLPAIPYLAMTWIFDPLRRAMGEDPLTWRKHLAWSAIAYSACALPLILAMFTIERRVMKRVKDSMPPLEPTASLEPGKNPSGSCIRRWFTRFALRFQQMDIFGWIFFVGFVTCVLTPWPAIPVIIAHGRSAWTNPTLLSILAAGFVSIFIFFFVEKKYVPYPTFPIQLLGEKRVLTALAMGFLYHLAFYVQQTYLYIGLIVRYGESKDAAARTIGLYAFTSTLFGLLMGVVISIQRDVRWYLRCGAILYLSSFIIQLVRPSGADNVNRLAVTCSQIILGVAGGLFPLPAMAFVQAAREHAQLATLIGAYMTACRMGGGIGQALVGAIWNNVLEPSLHRSLDGTPAGEGPASIMFSIPEVVNQVYSWGTPMRDRIVKIFVESHRCVCAIGIIASSLLIILAFLIKEAPLEGPKNDESTELGDSAGGIELKEVVGTPVTPSPLHRSRHPILF